MNLEEDYPESLEEIAEYKAMYKRKMTDIKIGVIGYSMQEFDKRKAIEHLKTAFNFIDKQHPDGTKTVISGLTDLGVPA